MSLLISAGVRELEWLRAFSNKRKLTVNFICTFTKLCELQFRFHSTVQRRWKKKSFPRFFFVLNFLNNKKCYGDDERKQEETSKFVNRFSSATFLLLRLPLKAHLQRISLAHFFFCVIDGNSIFCFVCKNKFAEKRATTLAFAQGNALYEFFSLRMQFFTFLLRFAIFCLKCR